MSDTRNPELPAAVVIGAGPAGMAFAARYSEAGGAVTVVEASPHLGGLARSFELWGASVDLGPHRFFSSDPVVNAYWHQHVAGEYVMVARQTRIFYRGKYYAYPLKAGNALRNLGPIKATAALASYVKSKVRPVQQDGSLETWVAARFGWRLYRTFFKTYTEKVWGIPCSDLDADWAAQRILGLTLWKAIKNALTGGRRNQLKTLVDEFAYPTQGNGVFYERQRQFIEQHGGSIRLSTQARRVLTQNDKVTGVQLADGSTLDAPVVVSSMPITTLVKGLDQVPEPVLQAASQLTFRNTMLVYLRIGSTEVFPDQWLYIHDPNLQHGRITNFNNWSRAMVADAQQTILCLEFWCFDNDQLWQASDDDVVALGSDELARTGLVARELILEGHVVRIARSYPVYRRGYQDHLDVVAEYLDTIDGLVPIGRYGSFKYNNQDHSILMGLLAADAVAQGRRPELWAINTDSTYQEAADARVLQPE